MKRLTRISFLLFAFVLIGQGCMEPVGPGTAIDRNGADQATTSTTLEIIPAEPGTLPSEPAEPAQPDPTIPKKHVDMRAGNFFFDPASIAVETGQEVEITFAENSGVHTFVIDEIGLKVPVVEGETIQFTAPSEGGTYFFYCDVGNHRAFGMEGTLHVKEL